MSTSQNNGRKDTQENTEPVRDGQHFLENIRRVSIRHTISITFFIVYAITLTKKRELNNHK